MKYSLNYYSLSKYNNTIDELTITYDRHSLKLIEFAKQRPVEQRLVVYLLTPNIDTEIEVFSAAAQAHPNIAFRLDISMDYQLLKENNLSYFYDIFPSTWDEVFELADAGCSDIFITNELGFEMNKVSAFCRARGIKVRVIPNVAQSSVTWNMKQDYDKKRDIVKFFVRPEDVPTYEPYVDYMEFWGGVLNGDYVYELYKEQKWLGTLSQIIIGYEGDAYNRELSNMFGYYRLNCGKRCNYQSCSICHQFSLMSTELFKNDKTLEYPRLITKEEYEEKIKYLKEQIEERKRINESRVGTIKADMSYESGIIIDDAISHSNDEV